MKLWTNRFKPVIDGQVMPVALETSWLWSRLVVRAHESADAAASDLLHFTKEPYRLHQVEVPAPVERCRCRPARAAGGRMG